jgi:hypothetical protein
VYWDKAKIERFERLVLGAWEESREETWWFERERERTAAAVYKVNMHVTKPKMTKLQVSTP